MSKISRKEFLSLLGLGTTGVVLSACTGCIKASGGTSKTVDITLDLTKSENAVLNQNGGYKLLSEGILVAKTLNNGEYMAVQSNCPHEGYGLKYDSSTNKVNCTNHTDQFFSTAGVSEGQQTNTNLKVYNVTQTGTSLRITS